MKKLSRFGLLILGSALVLVTLVNSAAAQRLHRDTVDAAGNTVSKLLAINKYHWKVSGCLNLGAVPIASSATGRYMPETIGIGFRVRLNGPIELPSRIWVC